MVDSNRKHRILVLGASGLTGGAIASNLDNGPADTEVVRAGRNKGQVEAWKREGKQAGTTRRASSSGCIRVLMDGWTIPSLPLRPYRTCWVGQR